LAVLHRLVAERPDRTTDELTRAYNRDVAPGARVHRSSVLRALRRTGYVFKKNDRDRRNKIVRASKPSATRSGSGSDEETRGAWSSAVNAALISRWASR